MPGCATKKAVAMPIFVLYAKAELENVVKFWVPEDHVWHFDVKQASGSEERKDVVISMDEVSEVPNTKNTTANFKLKFEGDKQFSYLKVLVGAELPKKLELRPQTADDTDMVPIFACECRGMEPVRWTPMAPYCAEGLGGTIFDEVDLRHDDWCDYEEKSGESVTVKKEVAYEFRLHRGK